MGQSIYNIFQFLSVIFILIGPFFLLLLFVYFLESYKDFFAYWMAVILSLLAHFAISFSLVYFDLTLMDVESSTNDDRVSFLLTITIFWFLMALSAAALNFLFNRRHQIAKALINFNQRMKK